MVVRSMISRVFMVVHMDTTAVRVLMEVGQEVFLILKLKRIKIYGGEGDLNRS